MLLLFHMKIKIIQLGKNKDQYIADGVDEFLKRLKPFYKIDIVTLKEISPSKTFAIDRVKIEEGAQVLKNINDDEFVFALDEYGKQFTSIDFASELKSKMDVGKSIVFIIGGPFGLSDELKNRADKLISMSKMTFTHQMIRVFLLEQIYRASCIIRGKEYHIA